jgi:hypothetical protein
LEQRGWGFGETKNFKSLGTAVVSWCQNMQAQYMDSAQ